MGDELNVRDAGTDEATGGSSLQGRLRSALLTPRLEPGSRAARSLRPDAAPRAGVSRARRPCRRRRAAGGSGRAARGSPDLARSRHTLCAARSTGRDAKPRPSWRVALHGLEHLIPAGFAAVLAESAEERADVVDAGRHASAGLADPRSSRTRRGRAARGADPTGHQPDPARHHLRRTSCRPIADLRRALLEAVYADATSLAVTLPRHPADVWLVVGGRALHAAGRFFDGEEPRGWIETATAILWRQLRELVHDDGGLRDRSPARHALRPDRVPRAVRVDVGERRGDPGVGAQAGARDDLLSGALAPSERRARAG